MPWDRNLDILLVSEILLLSAVVVGLVTMTVEEASVFRLYELLGGLMAAMITTFGLREMKDLT